MVKYKKHRMEINMMQIMDEMKKVCSHLKAFSKKTIVMYMGTQSQLKLYLDTLPFFKEKKCFSLPIQIKTQIRKAFTGVRHFGRGQEFIT